MQTQIERETGRTSRNLSFSLMARRQCPIYQLVVSKVHGGLTTSGLLLPSSKPPPAPSGKERRIMVHFTFVIFGIDPDLSTLSSRSRNGQRRGYRDGSIMMIWPREEEREVWRCPCADVSRCAAGDVSWGRRASIDE
jgi:hypothetical protein